MGFVLFFGVGLGFGAAIVATFLLSRRALVAVMPKGLEGAARRRTIAKGAAAGALIGFAPALLLGTVVGATLGSHYGPLIAEGARDSAVLAGVVGGVFAVATILLCASVALGAWVGRRIAAR
jgi:hypothetical protein